MNSDGLSAEKAGAGGIPWLPGNVILCQPGKLKSAAHPGGRLSHQLMDRYLPRF